MLDMDLLPLHQMFLPQFPCMDLQNALFTLMASCTIASDKGLHLTANEVQQWACAPGIPWSCHVPYLLEAAGLMEQQNVQGTIPCWAGAMSSVMLYMSVL